MNKTIKMITIIVGVGLLGYGMYTLIAPEASVSLGPLNVEAQDNTNSYVTLGLGLVVLLAGALVTKKS